MRRRDRRFFYHCASLLLIGALAVGAPATATHHDPPKAAAGEAEAARDANDTKKSAPTAPTQRTSPGRAMGTSPAQTPALSPSGPRPRKTRPARVPLETRKDVLRPDLEIKRDPKEKQEGTPPIVILPPAPPPLRVSAATPTKVTLAPEEAVSVEIRGMMLDGVREARGLLSGKPTDVLDARFKASAQNRGVLVLTLQKKAMATGEYSVELRGTSGQARVPITIEVARGEGRNTGALAAVRSAEPNIVRLRAGERASVQLTGSGLDGFDSAELWRQGRAAPSIRVAFRAESAEAARVTFAPGEDAAPGRDYELRLASRDANLSVRAFRFEIVARAEGGDGTGDGDRLETGGDGGRESGPPARPSVARAAPTSLRLSPGDKATIDIAGNFLDRGVRAEIRRGGKTARGFDLRFKARSSQAGQLGIRADGDAAVATDYELRLVNDEGYAAIPLRLEVAAANDDGREASDGDSSERERDDTAGGRGREGLTPRALVVEVTDDDTDDPIFGASVCLGTPEMPTRYGMRKTDGQGRASFGGVPENVDLVAIVSKDGYEGDEETVDLDIDEDDFEDNDLVDVDGVDLNPGEGGPSCPPGALDIEVTNASGGVLCVGAPGRAGTAGAFELAHNSRHRIENLYVPTPIEVIIDKPGHRRIQETFLLSGQEQKTYALEPIDLSGPQDRWVIDGASCRYVAKELGDPVDLEIEGEGGGGVESTSLACTGNEVFVGSLEAGGGCLPCPEGSEPDAAHESCQCLEGYLEDGIGSGGFPICQAPSGGPPSVRRVELTVPAGEFFNLAIARGFPITTSGPVASVCQVKSLGDALGFRYAVAVPSGLPIGGITSCTMALFHESQLNDGWEFVSFGPMQYSCSWESWLSPQFEVQKLAGPQDIGHDIKMYSQFPANPDCELTVPTVRLRGPHPRWKEALL